MMRNWILFASFALIFFGCASEPTETTEPAAAQQEAEPAAVTEGICLYFGPQTPRDISNKKGINPHKFDYAPPATAMNLCNVHMHTNAEHKGPGFSVFVDATDHGGYACNETADLTEAELEPLEGAFQGVKPGDTIEVHWVYTTCGQATPGEGLEVCVPEICGDALLRVEAQVFLVVNDEDALDFADFAYNNTVRDGLHQAVSLPSGTGEPVRFLGSTTGPDYTQENCSPAEVTWSVRPGCAKLDMASLHRWVASDNVFNETEADGVRQLVTDPRLLSEIP